MIGLVLGLAACASGSATPRETDDAAIFREARVEGAFVLRDLGTGAETVSNRALAGQAFLPCSTFKIPNTLVGLETGVIPDERFSLRWDGVRRARPEWNRDTDLASAMRFSVVWFYQEVARRIGPERMADWLRRLDYGNHDTSPRIDTFWLAGGLRVTAHEQVDFLTRLRARTLPVTRAHAELVERLIVLEDGEGWTLRGKTGLCETPEKNVGWLVGLADRGGHSWAYATLVLAPLPDAERLMPLRRTLTERLLVRHGALPRDVLR